MHFCVWDHPVCNKVVDLSENEEHTYQGDSTGAMNDYQTSCGNGGPGEEQIFKFLLHPSQTIAIHQNPNFDSVHELRVGDECPGEIFVDCVDDPVCFFVLLNKLWKTNNVLMPEFTLKQYFSFLENLPNVCQIIKGLIE